MRNRTQIINDTILLTLNSHRNQILECINFIDYWDRNFKHNRTDHPSSVRMYYWPSPDAHMNKEFGTDDERDYLEMIAFNIDTRTIKELLPAITDPLPTNLTRKEHRDLMRRARGVELSVIRALGRHDRWIQTFLFPEVDIRNPDKVFTDKDLQAAIEYNDSN